MNEDQLKKWKEKRQQRRDSFNRDGLLSGILKGDLQSLSSGITLLESNRKEDKVEAQKLINSCLKHSGKSIRVGVTGVPGVGKSTFIESFGQVVVDKGFKIAVLAIDPSSEKSGGSILGDKTRMNQLSVNENAFIRPSAAGKSLGGVARKTRESIILCEAAGYDFILIETVGVGQSETMVNSMVDFFMLLMLAGAGDELQGIKRGIMEMADALVITKADGDNLIKARRAKKEYENAMHLFPANENEWIPKALVASAYENYNIEKTFDTIDSFVNQTKVNGSFLHNRKQQDKYWLHETIADTLMSNFYSAERLVKVIAEVEQDVIEGRISSFEGAEKLMKIYNHE
ncbi:methylmalonyl Co-A mutase-associated GTPase MeaB [Brumimicrobium glaciale]|jgi:LAO/AO transport system kinase|uniref:Methylmalonyl Co-A mutase-associated GTPase MeaB n=1 Tax=Brumimicrobium glaciale TaxID=200475 RepID=A0A4Q4KH46_9FLAO|nr:methylmalonyl Co-A mutase-associated GTPase MeaB [Brumimicrobium glaciale]RYM31504.1 methylmalonyl Co-A mutase-associated GTPase MeaB [Brumimicrobium glaciale]